MILASLVLNVALIFCIAGLAVKFEKSRSILHDKTGAPQTVGSSFTNQGEEAEPEVSKEVANAGDRAYTKLSFAWFMYNLIIE